MSKTCLFERLRDRYDLSRLERLWRRKNLMSPGGGGSEKSYPNEDSAAFNNKHTLSPGPADSQADSIDPIMLCPVEATAVRASESITRRCKLMREERNSCCCGHLLYPSSF